MGTCIWEDKRRQTGVKKEFGREREKNKSLGNKVFCCYCLLFFFSKLYSICIPFIFLSV
ncbi:unnamed protein product [Prunus brigantina]